jgi:protein arginine kinase activator
MKCEKCQKNDATIHLTEIIKDVKSEVHLCEECARRIGLNAKISGFTISLPEVISNLEISDEGEMPAEAEPEEKIACMICGTSLAEYRKTRLLGCPDCYRYLGDSLTGILASHHPDMYHAGKIPSNSLGFVEDDLPVRILEEKGETLDQLKKSLREAVMDERYEEAAVLRDRIRSHVPEE